MLFLERKTDRGFSYELKEIFGELRLKSTIRLDKDILDSIVMLLLNSKAGGQLTGAVKVKGGKVHYSFKREQAWEEDKKQKKCENIPTSIKKRAKGFIQTSLLKIRIISSLVKFVAAFREAWKKQGRKLK